MTTNKIQKLSEVERDVLRLLATEVDENGSVDRGIVAALLGEIPRRGALLNGLARKGLVEVSLVRDCVVVTAAGAVAAEDATREHAQKQERAQIAGEIARIATSLRGAVAAGDATAAELCARTLPATRERFHISSPDAEALWVDATVDGAPSSRTHCHLLSANDAIRDDARGAACRAAAAVFEYVARSRADFPEVGRWYYLPEERASVARIAKAVAHRIEDAKTKRESLAAAVAQGGAEWALKQYGEQSVLADRVALAFAPVAKVAADSPEDVDAVREVVAVVRKEAERELVLRRPWAHNSTCPMSDLMNLYRADGLAEVVQFAERLLW